MITEEEVTNFLEEQKKQLNYSHLARLIRMKISPSRTYLRSSPLFCARLEDSETYCRSEMHPISKELSKRSHIFYENVSLIYGARSHVGGYGNSMQMLGDTLSISATKIPTSEGNSILYEMLLCYKNNFCEYIQNYLKDKLKNITVGFYNDYPCVMVYIKESSVCKHIDTKKPTDSTLEEWVNLLASYFVGLMNYKAYAVSLPIEMERRSSFGFLVPTIASTKKSFRINIGIVPKKYAELLISSLKILDNILEKLKLSKDPIPDQIFYSSEQYKKYLNGTKYQIINLSSFHQLLWAQIEKRGKTTLQNIVRTAYAREGIAIAVFESLKKNTSIVKDVDNNIYKDAFLSGLEWAVKQICVKKYGDTLKLSCKQTKNIGYSEKFQINVPLSDDEYFWGIIKKIITNITDAAVLKNSDILKKAIVPLNNCCNDKNLVNLYYYLEFLHELIFISAIGTANQEQHDGYGSDSEQENDVDGNKLFAKKIIVHNGMRSIWSSIIAATNYLQEHNLSIKCKIYLDCAYYEVPLGIPLIKQLHNLNNLTVTQRIELSDIILYDLNACITNNVINKDYYISGENKILILDCTSSTINCIRQHLKRFIDSNTLKAILLVDSGLKNQQLGADKNLYGTVRIFTKDSSIREYFYKKIKEIEKPLLSSVSHRHRRIMKSFGATLVTKYLIGIHKEDLDLYGNSFLEMIVHGEQNKAEEMLKVNKQLVLFHGKVIDPSGQIFEWVTGFQYAVWALDGHMWNMLLRYLDCQQAQEQIRSFEQNKYIENQSIPNLIEKLKKYLDADSYDKWSECWKEVGEAQRKAPIHVINEYCRSDNSFNPCLSSILLRCIKVNNQTQDALELIKHDGYGLLRGNLIYAEIFIASLIAKDGRWKVGHSLENSSTKIKVAYKYEDIRKDHQTLIAFSKQRLEQKHQLIVSLQQDPASESKSNLYNRISCCCKKSIFTLA